MDLNDREARDSRHLPLLQRLTGLGPEALRAKIDASRILLECTLPRDSSAAAAPVIELLVNMIARFCPRIDLFLPNLPIDRTESLLRDAQAIDSRPGAFFKTVGSANPNDYPAIIAIGPSRMRHPGLVSVGCHGWHSDVQVGSPSRDVPLDGSNILGMAGAAVHAASVAFRMLFGLRSNPHEPPFCWYHLVAAGSCSGDPPAPSRLALPPTLLAGAGAVGGAIVELLARLPGVEGLFIPVDFDVIKNSDLNRHPLAREDHVTDPPIPKLEIVKRRLLVHPDLRVVPFHGRVEAVASWLRQSGIPYPLIALCGLDSLPSRRELQLLWTDWTVEGATHELTFRTFVSRFGAGQACICCSHGTPSRDEGGTYHDIAESAGVSAAFVLEASRNPGSPLSEEHLRGIPNLEMERLKPHLGRSLCSVLADLKPISSGDERPHQLVVSFVSMASALGVLTRLHRILNRATDFENLFQADFELLIATGTSFSPTAISNCDCVRRRVENEAIRALRLARNGVNR